MADPATELLEQYYNATKGKGAVGVPAAVRVVTLPPSSFVTSWEKRPQAPVEVGLRIVGEAALLAEQRAAWDVSKDIEDDGLKVTSMESHAITGIVAAAMCKPKDATASWWDAPGARNQVRTYLTPAAVKRLWEEYELLDRMLSPVSEQADDATVATLAEMVADGSLFADLNDEEEARVRRCFSMIWDTTTRVPTGG